MKLSKPTKIIGILAALLFSCSMTALLVFIYHIKSSDELLTEQKTERARAESHRRELDSLARLANETVSEREELSNYILRSDGVIEFLSLIEALGREQGVEMKTNSLETVAQNGLFEELRVEILTTGSYESILHLLSLFETLPYQSYVSGVSLYQSGNRWSAQFTLRVTKFKES